MSQVKTRNTTCCPVFGLPEKLPLSQLPTYNAVMKNYLFIKYELKPDKTTKEPTVHDISERLTTEILDIWRKASLPTVSFKRVLKLIRTYHDKYRGLLKPYQGRKMNKKYQQKIAEFVTESQRLFDVCSCKCKLISECTCSKDNRVPREEVSFLLDQRTTRKMMIGGVDLVATEKNIKKFKRHEKELLRKKEIVDTNQPSCSRSLPDNLTIESASSSNNSVASSPYQSPKQTAAPPTKKKRLNLPSLALACDRTGVSDRAAAIIASSVLKDVGIITSKDPSAVIDRSKLRRERTKVRSALYDADRNKSIRGIYFDGRKDKTLVNIQKEGKFYRKRVIEDHYVILSEPGSDYFGHVTCELGTARGIESSIINHLRTKSVELDKIIVVGCDGTVVNTGFKGGVCKMAENSRKRQLRPSTSSKRKVFRVESPSFEEEVNALLLALDQSDSEGDIKEFLVFDRELLQLRESYQDEDLEENIPEVDSSNVECQITRGDSTDSSDDALPLSELRKSNFYYGKNCYKWSKTPPNTRVRTLQHNIITHACGLKLTGENAKDPLSIWHKLIDDEMLQQVLTRTNKKIASYRMKFARQNKPELKDIDITELKAFVGLLLYSPVLKSNHERTGYLFARDATGCEIFRCGMSENRFLILLLCLIR
ncbi:uncharacterized protein LOC132903564 [Amyelois transitella]|uniref:uncharacterized protein LOC132903564 n=1 Tax=Amyelois transitella TaxID=680683 RepID=UPI0029905AAD|nr:uncharacterized protein LOC132903564 [Amyelois transitella]